MIGTMVLADNASLYSIEINIEKKRNLPKIINAIKKEIGLSKEEIENFYEKKNINILITIP